jgi:hypothetical protein
MAAIPATLISAREARSALDAEATRSTPVGAVRMTTTPGSASAAVDLLSAPVGPAAPDDQLGLF